MSGNDGWTSVKYSIFFSISDSGTFSDAASSITLEIRNCFASTESIYRLLFSMLPCVLLWLSFCSLPENRRTDTHARRSFLDGHLEVMRHAHREHVHANARHLAPSDRVAQFAQLSKERSCALGIVGEWRNCHETTKLQSLQSWRCQQQ